ncbi:hypothetical protein SRB17_77270 [Streptomyces sp. RB17]|uniref:hypothetical protein n=1 Tax=Streptomyces sp. RB17 TaxID=2585197 RepID=UPI00130B5EF5|nr:hypothetical protein [Streptomyces sp. RB17]MQY39700.1 hypothetical protein [Streptomyces sp. RB17]
MPVSLVEHPLQDVGEGDAAGGTVRLGEPAGRRHPGFLRSSLAPRPRARHRSPVLSGVWKVMPPSVDHSSPFGFVVLSPRR